MPAHTAPANYVILLLQCPDQHGIVAAVSSLLSTFGCNIVQSAQYADETADRFFMRVRFSLPTGADQSAIETAFAPLGAKFQMDWRIFAANAPVRTAILVSKPDHCLLDLMQRVDRKELCLDVAFIGSNHEAPKRIADHHGVPFHYLPVTKETKADQERQLLELCAHEDVELVILARYMQVLTNEACEKLAGRAINIHHSFLPSFKGAKPYHQAHQRGVKLIGATAHFVTSDLDEGPIIEQESARVDHAMTPDDLIRIGRDVERRTLAQAVRWYTERRILLNGQKTVILR